MDVVIEELTEITDEVVAAFKKLLPQLSSSAPALDATELDRIVSAHASTVLVARADGAIVGTMTLATFPLPTGIRAWVEDVVVDDAVRGHGVGEALIRTALEIATKAGARTVDLTSRQSREAAGRLYERLGFKLRETRFYRYIPDQS